MKHVVFVGTCVIAVLITSCTLPDPVAVGDECTGIKAENIVWGILDSCMKYGNRQVCDAEAEEVIQLAGGYCPIGFICRHDEDGLPWCVHSCPEGQVFCGEACINPKTSISYCGASLGSVCDSKTRGENCMKLVSQNGFAYTCDEHEGCKKTICPMDTYLSHDETCLPNNDENCGLEGFSCGKDKECIHGDCKIRCPKDYIRCDDKNGESLCIYPENNTMFCGAKGKCQSSDPTNKDYRGVACGEGMTCAQGHCVVWKCDKENERLCDDKCIDVTQDPLNCGGCGHNCADNRPPHVTDEVACANRQCVYTCEAGYDNCGSDGTMECVDLTWDRNHCGACGEACGPKAYCMASTCKFVSCSMDCTTLPHASAVQCVSGECQIKKCETGYYLLENVCETDTDDNCGSYGNKCQVPNGTSHCQNGTCITTGCDVGFHQEENYCTGDDLNSCGGTDCTAIPGWLSGLCEDTSCKATGCQPGFYLDGSTCKSNDQNNCGEKGKECTVSNGTSTCDTSTGTCTTPVCNTGYYLDGTTCKSNDQNNCGTKGKKCTVSNGTATCDTSTGTCNTTGCNMWFELVDGACVSTLVVGAEVEFGRYPQNEDSNTPSPITWQVLEVTTDSALLISKYILEQYQYHDKSENITWEQSNVRSYLNGFDGTHNKNGIDHTSDGFFKNAFSDDEQSRIKEVTNKNPNGKWTESTPGGNDTKDKVFLLSHDEVLQYFPTRKSQVASPTAYAIHSPGGSGRDNLYTCQVTCSGDDSCSTSSCNKNGTDVQVCSNVQCSSRWWLRSPGNSPYSAAYVFVGGGVGSYYVSCDDIGLRPALHVYLNL